MANERKPRDEVLIELCDADALWGPLGFLRPARDKAFGSARLLLVCGMFGGFYGMCASLVFVMLHRCIGSAVPPVYAAPLFLTLTSFVCGELAFARAWNRRAGLINRRLAWAESNARAPRPSR
ncbi:MAG: hypothetical protein QM756_25145 [Polyangiaceae bacterium]